MLWFSSCKYYDEAVVVVLLVTAVAYVPTAINTRKIMLLAVIAVCTSIYVYVYANMNVYVSRVFHLQQIIAYCKRWWYVCQEVGGRCSSSYK